MTTPEQMPMAHSRKAPRFASDPSGFDEFFEDVKELACRAAIDDTGAIKWALRYAGLDGETWRYVPCMIGKDAKPTLDQFTDDVRKCYPHLSANRRYTNHDLEILVQRTSNFANMARDDFGEYYRKFLPCASYLIQNERFSEREKSHSYLQGFPQPVRDKILNRLAIKKPDVIPTHWGKGGTYSADTL